MGKKNGAIFWTFLWQSFTEPKVSTSGRDFGEETMTTRCVRGKGHAASTSDGTSSSSDGTTEDSGSPAAPNTGLRDLCLSAVGSILPYSVRGLSTLNPWKACCHSLWKWINLSCSSAETQLCSLSWLQWFTAACCFGGLEVAVPRRRPRKRSQLGIPFSTRLRRVLLPTPTKNAWRMAWTVVRGRMGNKSFDSRRYETASSVLPVREEALWAGNNLTWANWI